MFAHFRKPLSTHRGSYDQSLKTSLVISHDLLTETYLETTKPQSYPPTVQLLLSYGGAHSLEGSVCLEGTQRRTNKAGTHTHTPFPRVPTGSGALLC